MYCKKCGSKIMDGAKFCGNCGTPVTKRAESAEIPIKPEPPGKPEPEEKTPKKSRRKWLKGIAAVLVVAIVILLVTGVYQMREKTNFYVVTFNCNSADADIAYAPEAQTVSSGSQSSCPSYPTREGYIFNGWCVDENCTEPYDFKSEVSEDLVLYAGWVDADSEEAQITDEEIEQYMDSMESVDAIYEQYTDKNGYVASEEEAAELLDALEEYALQLLDDGTITYYSREDDAIYMEYASMLTCVLGVPEEGTLSNASDLEASLLFPFDSSDPSFLTYMDNGLIEMLFEWGNISISSCWNDHNSVESFLNLNVGDLFIIATHGCYVSELGCVFYTGEAVTGESILRTYPELLSQKYLTIADAGNVGYFAITPRFVSEFFPSMDGTLVILDVCQSGMDGSLASAFLSRGAEAVITYSDNVYQWYAYMITFFTLRYLEGEGEDGSPYHTVEEAFEMAEDAVGDYCHLPDWLDLSLFNGNPQDVYKSAVFYYTIMGSYVVAESYPTVPILTLRSDTDSENYTLYAGVEGEITFADEMSESDKKNILSSMTVRLMTEDGEVVDEAEPDKNGVFYNNRIEPGNYTMVLYQNGECVSENIDVEVTGHRYTAVSLECSKLVTLEGYVYDTDGEPLSNVTVSADMTAGSDLWNAETRTNDEGYYALEVYGQNTYTLTYSKSGYTKEEITFEITPELFEAAQEGAPCTLEDVELSLEELLPWKEIYAEYIQKIMDDDGSWSGRAYALVYVDGDEIPELYVSGGSAAEGDRICTIDSSGSIVECWLNRVGGAAYIEKSGMFYNYNGNNGILTLNFYSLEDGAFAESDISGESIVTYDEESDDFIPAYTWNGKTVSGEEFYANWDNIMARAQATPFYDVSVSASEILNVLADNDDNGETDQTNLTVYTSVVQQYEDTYGTLDYNIYYQNQEAQTGKAYMLTGLCLVQPIDFDGDSVDELLIGYGETADASTGQTEVYGDIWGLDGDTPVLLYSGASFPGESYYNAIAYKSEGGVCYLYDGYSGNRFAHVDIYGLEDGSFTKVYALEADFSSDSPHYTLNGTAISMNEYASYVSDGLMEFYAQVYSLEDFETCQSDLAAAFSEVGLQ